MPSPRQRSRSPDTDRPVRSVVGSRARDSGKAPDSEAFSASSSAPRSTLNSQDWRVTDPPGRFDEEIDDLNIAGGARAPTVPDTPSLNVVGRAVIRAFSKTSSVTGLDHDLRWRLEELKTDFKLWANSRGILRTGLDSMDYRSRDSPIIQDQIRQVLSELKQELSKLQDTSLIKRPLESAVVHIVVDDDSSDEEIHISKSMLPKGRLRPGYWSKTFETGVRSILSQAEFLVKNLYQLTSQVRDLETAGNPSTSDYHHDTGGQHHNLR